MLFRSLIVGGFEWVYEFSRNFRNEGMDRTHNPEFTVLEFYVAYKDYEWMMDTTEQMLERAAVAVNGSSSFMVGDKEISFKAPFRRVTMYDAIKEHTGFDISKEARCLNGDLRAIAARFIFSDLPLGLDDSGEHQRTANSGTRYLVIMSAPNCVVSIRSSSSALAIESIPNSPIKLGPAPSIFGAVKIKSSSIKPALIIALPKVGPASTKTFRIPLSKSILLSADRSCD